jgi:hypothetical protein
VPRFREWADWAAKHGDRAGALHWLDRALGLIPTAPGAGLPDPEALRREIARRRADLAADDRGPDAEP